jgi:hypothetical protein
MNATRLLMAVTLCVLLCVMLCVVVDNVHAQAAAKGKGATGGDKDLSSKKGLEVLGSVNNTDPTKLPTKFKKMVGIGSIFVMIAVMKWL